jgi:uncharacterized delta-60 repeat protein
MRYGIWLSFACLYVSPPLYSASVDTTFGVNGRAVLELNNASSQATAAILQSDGKIVVVGMTPAIDFEASFDPRDASRDFLVARFNADGELDTGFSGDGVATIDFNGNEDRALAVAQQPDGKLVLAGYGITTRTDFDFEVARLNTDGTPDASFNGTGKVTISFPCKTDTFGVNGEVIATAIQDNGNDYATALAIQADGKLLIGGANCDAARLALARLNTDGSADTSYGNLSPGRTNFQGMPLLSAMSVEANGEVAAGIRDGYGRVGSDGKNLSVFTPFALPFSAVIFARSMVPLPNGGYLVGANGQAFLGTAGNVLALSSVLIRLDATLQADTAFGDDGAVFNANGEFDNGFGHLALEPNGKILAGGYAARVAGNEGVTDGTISRFNVDGTADSTFGTNGLMRIDFSDGASNYSYIGTSFLRMANGKLILVGNRGFVANNAALIENRLLAAASQRIVLVGAKSDPLISFTQATVTGSEGNGSLVLNVTRTGTTNGPVTVDYATSAGSAAASSDFTTLSGTLVWQPGDANTKTISIPLTNDSTQESNEDFTVQLSNPSEGSIETAAATATVSDDDPEKKSGGGGAIDLSTWLMLLGTLAGIRGRRYRAPRAG